MYPGPAFSGSVSQGVSLNVIWKYHSSACQSITKLDMPQLKFRSLSQVFRADLKLPHATTSKVILGLRHVQIVIIWESLFCISIWDMVM